MYSTAPHYGPGNSTQQHSMHYTIILFTDCPKENTNAYGDDGIQNMNYAIHDCSFNK